MSYLVLITTFILLIKIISPKLQGVIHINRHGARTPQGFIDLTNKIFFKANSETLTINGMRQLDLLGKWVRERYILKEKLISKNYQPNEMIFKSSPTERTIFSAYSFIKGVYPSVDVKNIFPDHLMKNDDVPPIPDFKLNGNYEEIPVEVMDPDNDPYFQASQCRIKGYNETIKEMMEKYHVYNFTQAEINQTLNEVREQLPELFENETDEEIYTFQFLKKVNSFLISAQYHYDNHFFNLTQEADTIFKKVQIGKWYEIRILKSLATVLVNSGLYDDMLNYFKGFLNGSQTKYVFYSGHDNTLISIFTSILSSQSILDKMADLDKYYNFLQPPFASSLLFEIHSVERHFLQNKFVVKIIYNNTPITEGFDHRLKYDEELGGIEFGNFSQFLISEIDYRYKSLDCKRRELK